VRCATAGEPSGAGIEHEMSKNYLDQFNGQSKEGEMVVDVTASRRWTWAALSDCEIRLHVDTGSDRDLKADAVGWKVLLYPASTGRDLSSWSE